MVWWTCSLNPPWMHSSRSFWDLHVVLVHACEEQTTSHCEWLGAYSQALKDESGDVVMNWWSEEVAVADAKKERRENEDIEIILLIKERCQVRD